VGYGTPKSWLIEPHAVSDIDINDLYV